MNSLVVANARQKTIHDDADLRTESLHFTDRFIYALSSKEYGQ